MMNKLILTERWSTSLTPVNHIIKHEQQLDMAVDCDPENVPFMPRDTAIQRRLRSAAWTYKSLGGSPLISPAICSDFSNGEGSPTYYHCFPSCATPRDNYWDPHSVDKEQTNLLHSRNRTCIQSQTKNSSYDSECRIIMQIVVLYLENRTQVISLWI